MDAAERNAHAKAVTLPLDEFIESQWPSLLGESAKKKHRIRKVNAIYAASTEAALARK